jgi:hypothetical protein
MADSRTEKPEHFIDVPEAVGVFGSSDALQAAMDDLLIAGFSRFDISVLASAEAATKKLKKAMWRSRDLEDHPDAPRKAFVSEEAIGGLEGAVSGAFVYLGSMIAMMAMLNPASTLAASVAAAVIGGSPGAVVGALLARRIGQKHSEYYADQIERGGILLWVRCATPEKERLAVEIMKGHSGQDVHVHAWSES